MKSKVKTAFRMLLAMCAAVACACVFMCALPISAHAEEAGSGAAYDRSNLPDGSYDVSVSLNQASAVDSESMAGVVLAKDATLKVTNGSYYLRFTLDQGASVQAFGASYAAYVSKMSYYPDGYTLSGGAMTALGSPSRVDEYEYVTVDGVNYVTKVGMPLNAQSVSEGYVCMYATFSQMGGKLVAMKIDWDAFDAAYGPAEEEVEVDRSALAQQIAAAQAVSDDGSIDYDVLAAAIADAQSVYDDAEATQAQVNMQTSNLAAAVDSYTGASAYSFKDGGSYRAPLTLLQGNLKTFEGRYFQDTVVIERSGDTYNVQLTTTAENDAIVTSVSYGSEGLVADVSVNDDATHTYTLHVASVLRAIPLSVVVQVGNFNPSTTTVYASIDASQVTVLSEPSSEVDDPDQPEEPSSDDPTPEVATVAMNRLYNPNGGEHFYTASDEERDGLVALGWQYEGTGWVAPETSDTPVYRLYNPNGGDHHYTTSAEERDWLVSLGWSYEGIGWYSDDAQTVKLYREYNPNAQSGSHNYTTSLEEHKNLVNLGWHDEGTAWYGVAAG